MSKTYNDNNAGNTGNAGNTSNAGNISKTGNTATFTKSRTEYSLRNTSTAMISKIIAILP